MKTYFTKDKHYNTLNEFYKHKFGKKVFKIPLNGGFTCPTLDGKISKKGCSFCSAYGAGEFAGKKGEDLEIQFQKGIEMMENKWKDGLYIPYFQAFTNTYAPVCELKKLFEKAITLSDKIVGISISTRPDCLPNDVLEYLDDLNKRIPVQIELGLQTIHKKTSLIVNRGHDLKTFDDAVMKLRKINIEVVVHIINGLPYETKEMMIDTVKHLSKLDIQGLKIHMLNIVKNSRMGYLFQKQPWDMISREDYIDICYNQILHLRKDIIIHRLTGDGLLEDLIAPSWIPKKFTILNDIDKMFRFNNTYQGDLYKE